MRDAKGVNIIEAAIVMSLLLLVCFSVAEYATIFYVNLALQNGVSQATRFGVTESGDTIWRYRRWREPFYPASHGLSRSDRP